VWIKGIDKFQHKVPILSGKKLFLLPLYAISILLICLSVMVRFDSLPEVMFGKANPLLLSFFPLIGELIICLVGLILVYQMWFWMDKLKAKYGPLSYQHIFIAGFTGVASILSLSINLFVHYWSFSPIFWQNSSIQFLTIPLDQYFFTIGALIFYLKIFFSFFFSVLGVAMIFRSLKTFGFDYMTVIYLYFPEESKIQNHKIYSVLRHPTYTGALLIGLGGMFFTLTIYSIIFFLIYFLTFYIHIHFVEEKELITRFGSSYQEYIKKVPAFFVSPKKFKILLKFLLGAIN
jgi:protein-S-isoprenylcysteine O-methyltransferase Ste14